MSFKRHFHLGNPFLFSGATAVQSRPKSHIFTLNLAVVAPQPRWRQTPWNGLFRGKWAMHVSGDLGIMMQDCRKPTFSG